MTDTTKADLEKKVAQLTEENEKLRGEVVAATAGAAARPAGPQHTFFLTEGNRLELEQTGVTSIGGVRMTRDQVLAELKRSKTQSGVEIAEPKPGADVSGVPTVEARRAAVYGVDFVYPSVVPGKVDPAVAGQPGINGPAASKAEVARTRSDVVAPAVTEPGQ